ncbi:glycosyltransferase family 2 protein [Clostridium sp. SYSU_GA19001]|uniref:glycosyltransferase family 2 protein n=1 Tax=Clostridium caldaquaticum TaxID=2940653 RepID=UPI002076FC26|nr:glycosyltransferase family 2 protein [Clostridium caldaquaticum]MCM8709616.1 glycosyltransferase family 2 protein [Clostridium caldaquaticum]
MNSKLISIVVPMYFEEKVVEECYRRLTAVAIENSLNYELIFVNDGSTDKTLELLEEISKKDMHVKVISFSRNFGHQIAVTAGIDKAKGDAAVIIDADLQDPPELIPEMIRLWQQGYDVVYGKRKKREGERFFKLATAKLFYRLFDKLCNIKIPLDTGDFRLIDRKVIEALKKMPEHNRFLRGMSSWIGFKQIPLEYERKERFAGETKYPFKKMLKFALDGIFSFSSKPLKFVEYLGSAIIFFALAMLVYYFISFTSSIEDAVSLRWSLILTVITFIGGIQLLSIGIIGEYVSRIYDESKGRPLYIIDKELNMDKELEKPLYSFNRKIHLDKTISGRLYLISRELNKDKEYGVK